jgi:predicted nucleotidyltransferase
MMSRIEYNLGKLESLCKKNNVSELYLFGSAVSGTFNSKSDLDFAVVFDKSLSPLEHGNAFFALIDDLENLFQRPVDLLSYRALKNPIFKEELDSSKVSVYAA